MRKLVTIQKVDAVLPIPDADAIECVQIGGWKIVTRKGEYQPNDLCVFFEIDSVLPVRPEYEFLRKSSFIKNDVYEGFRLKTIKLRKQISQGLVVKVPVEFADLDIGTDVTELMGVVKYEPTIPTTQKGNFEGAFPSFIPRTDQERIQNLSVELKNWIASEDTWEVTEKLEGQSMTVYFKDGKVGVCTRNWELKEDDHNTQWSLVKKLGLDTKLIENGVNVTIQGELIGPGIQGNHYKLTEPQFRVFDIFLIDEQNYVCSENRLQYCDIMKLDHSPVLSECMTIAPDMTMNSLLEFADGPSILNPMVSREGLVFKNLVNPSESFKIVSNDYLLKEK